MKKMSRTSIFIRALLFFLATTVGYLWVTYSYADNNINTYFNEYFGIEITKPASWFFLSANQRRSGMSNVTLNDEELTALLHSGAPFPIASIAKYIDFENRQGLIPTVNLAVINVDSKRPLDVLNDDISLLKRGVSNFKYIKKPQDAKLAGKDAAFAEFTFSQSDQNGVLWKGRSELWIVLKGSNAITLGLSTPAEGPDASRKEMEQILKSLKFHF
jgi:hypothetical protein